MLPTCFPRAFARRLRALLRDRLSRETALRRVSRASASFSEASGEKRRLRRFGPDWTLDILCAVSYKYWRSDRAAIPRYYFVRREQLEFYRYTPASSAKRRQVIPPASSPRDSRPHRAPRFCDRDERIQNTGRGSVRITWETRADTAAGPQMRDGRRGPAARHSTLSHLPRHRPAPSAHATMISTTRSAHTIAGTSLTRHAGDIHTRPERHSHRTTHVNHACNARTHATHGLTSRSAP